MTPSMRWPLLGGLALLSLVGCTNAGNDLGFEATGGGTVSGLVYLDRDGSLDPAAGADTTFAGIRVGLVVAGTNDTAFTDVTDANGNVSFSAVPFGDYLFVVDTSTVGDSLQVQAIDTALVTLRFDDPNQVVVARLGFPTATVAAARGLAAGTRVFVKGIVVAELGTFGDTTAHIAENGVAIRVVNGLDAGLQTQVGDTVRVLGTIASRSGQPVLDSARIFFVRQAANPTAFALSTLEASNADGGTQDAALVQITGGTITDTATVGADYHVTVDDGTGPLVIVLDGDIGFGLAQFDIGAMVTGRGVLVPIGGGTWVFKPRASSDVTVS